MFAPMVLNDLSQSPTTIEVIEHLRSEYNAYLRGMRQVVMERLGGVKDLAEVVLGFAEMAMLDFTLNHISKYAWIPAFPTKEENHMSCYVNLGHACKQFFAHIYLRNGRCVLFTYSTLFGWYNPWLERETLFYTKIPDTNCSYQLVLW